MKKSTKFSPEVRERAVRMAQEHRGEYPSLWATIESIASKIGCVPQGLRFKKLKTVGKGITSGCQGPHTLRSVQFQSWVLWHLLSTIFPN